MNVRGCLLWLASFTTLANAGQNCTVQAASAVVLQQASQAAERSFKALEDGPGDVALIARVGQDLSQFGLRYSHVGFAVRHHAQGRWTIVHQLNQCGTDSSDIYAEGLLNFFLDGMVSYDSKIVWLQPDVAQQLLAVLDSELPETLHDPDYNVIARWDSTRMQNSTAWVLALLGAALEPGPRPRAHQAAVQVSAQHGFVPSRLSISYGKRLMGGLFSANASFTDHPLSARLGGHYEVVTVRSIFDWLRHAGLVHSETVLGSNNPAD